MAQLKKTSLTDAAQEPLPAGAAAAFASGSAVAVLAVSGTSRHQQLGRLHLTLALLGDEGPGTVGRKPEGVGGRGGAKSVCVCMGGGGHTRDSLKDLRLKLNWVSTVAPQFTNLIGSASPFSKST